MSYRPLTYFTALSVAAHVALIGLWSEPVQTTPQLQESSIEIGLVILPRIDDNFSKNLKQSQLQTQSELNKTRVKTSTAVVKSAKQTDQKVSEEYLEETRPETPELTDRAEQTKEDNNQAVTEPNSSEQAAISPLAATEAAPVYSKNPAPSYPVDALRYGWEGEVWLKVDINRNGAVVNITIDQSSGYRVLDKAAVKSVRNWQFEPARIGSETIEGSVLVPIRFRIKRS